MLAFAAGEVKRCRGLRFLELATLRFARCEFWIQKGRNLDRFDISGVEFAP
jgi:hypothetical protein